MAIKLIITDDHPVVTNGLQKMFANTSNIEVIAIYNSGTALLNGIKMQQPDILLLDMNLPDIEGPKLATSILKDYPLIKIIVLSSSDILFQVKKMLQIGCMGYLLKDSDDLTIIQAIEEVYKGGQFLSPKLQQSIVDDMFRNKHIEKKKQAGLTRREKEILKLITEEFTNNEIAEKLFISQHTVENHRISLLHKLDVKNTAGLVRVAVETGLV